MVGLGRHSACSNFVWQAMGRAPVAARAKWRRQPREAAREAPRRPRRGAALPRRGRAGRDADAISPPAVYGESVGGFNPPIFLEKLAREPHSNLIFADFLYHILENYTGEPPITQEGGMSFFKPPGDRNGRRGLKTASCPQVVGNIWQKSEENLCFT